MAVYIDTNIFIYWLVADEKHGETAKKIIAKIEGGMDAVTSALTIVQIDWILHNAVKNYSFGEVLSKMSTIKNLKIAPLSKEILYAAQQCANEFSFSIEDAVHYATANDCGCESICSNDKDFDNADINRYFG